MENLNYNPAIPERTIYTVSQLNSAVRLLLEENLESAWISGEISNLAQPSSGHIYFSLKDETAQVRCAMFRGSRQKLSFQPKNGMRVLVYAAVSLYEARGDYQLIASLMEEAGSGLLHEKFLKLKAQLAAEGLFDEPHKKPLPKFPQCIGVITSPTGAAIKDILNVLNRRFPAIPIIIYPTQVQGTEAATQIAAALNLANQRGECDVLILTRGGGSLEDLWSFNEELVARAIYASKIPIVTGIGHEIDFTIADFVADQRAPTPSAAAELIVPDIKDLTMAIAHLGKRLSNLIQHKLQQAATTLALLKNQLKHPSIILKQQMQKLDDLEQKLQVIIKHQLQHQQEQLNGLTRALEIVSPLATLARGYAIITKNTNIVRSVHEINAGDLIHTQLQDGKITSIVQSEK